MPAQKSYTSDHLKVMIFLTVIFVLMLTIKADTVLYSWFDEGWTLTTARNWLEQGEYALRLGDTWVSAETMTQSFTVTAPIAVSFKIFGVGLVSGRLPGMLYTIGMLAWMFAITNQLYSSRVAWGAVLLTLMLPPSPEFQPFIVGRQALGEIPMLFFLLGGYWFLLQALRQPPNFFALIYTSLFWGLALITKSQPLPFWLLSLLIPLWVALKNKDYQATTIFGLATIGTAIFVLLFTRIENSLLASAPLYGPPVSSNYLKSLVWSTNVSIRYETALTFLGVGVFPVTGIIYYIKKNLNVLKSETHLEARAWVEFSIGVLVCSWNIWYLTASWGWQRYHMPAFIICWLFFAKALHDATDGFDWQKTLKKLSSPSAKSWKNSMPQLGTSLLLAISIAGLWANTSDLASILRMTDRSIYELTEYVLANTAPNAHIETYESEFLFMLPNRQIHFPPHQTEEELNRRSFLHENINITYDPLTADPDILIIGNFAKGWQLYASTLAKEEFKLITQIGQYDVYQRIR